MARGLPDGVTVAQLFLVQFVLVRIQVRQPNKKEAATKVAVFLCPKRSIKLA
jgi:ferredoxin